MSFFTFGHTLKQSQLLQQPSAVCLELLKMQEMGQGGRCLHFWLAAALLLELSTFFISGIVCV